MRHQGNECLAWRTEATALLRDANLTAIDPARRDYRGLTDSELSAVHQSLVEADLQDLESCVAVLAHPFTPSIGTAMECWHAYSLGRPVVVVGKPISPWYQYAASYVTESLADAVRWLSKGGTVSLFTAQLRRASRHGTVPPPWPPKDRLVGASSDASGV